MLFSGPAGEGSACVISRFRGARRVIDDRLVHVAPLPVLAGLERPDDGVPRLREVRRRVLVRRAVAATDVPARLAHPQVEPAVAPLPALRAPGIGRLDV